MNSSIFFNSSLLRALWLLCFLFSLTIAGPPRKGPIDWGVYQIYWHQQTYENQLTQQIKTLEGRPRYAMFFRDLIRPFPLGPIQVNDSLGLTTIVSLEITIWSRNKQTEKNYLDRILSGEFDEHFLNWARGAKKYSKKVIYRFGFEMNGGWFSWGKQPEKFVKVWKHVHKIFQKEGATNVQWMFSPNVLWGKRTFTKDILPYYPGDEFVDLAGLDGYNFGEDKSEHHEWSLYDEVFENSIGAMQKIGKPLFIAEIGCHDDPRKSEWVKDFLSKVSHDKRVHAFIWFNYDKRSEGESNWRLDSDSETLKVFKNWSKIP